MRLLGKIRQQRIRTTKNGRELKDKYCITSNIQSTFYTSFPLKN
jgi:hypothetical protein